MTDILPHTAKQQILDGLSSADGEVRRLAVEQLSLLEIEEAVPHMANRLGDEVWRVRKSAVERLVRCIDYPPVQEILIASLADGEDPGRRNSAFEALVACGSRVTSRLVQELRNPDVDVRKLVVDALAGIADPDSRGPLVEMISDPDTNIRAAAIEALGTVGSENEISNLVAAAANSEEDVLVRLSALRALSRLEACVSVDSLGTALDQPALRPSAVTLLGLSDDAAAIEVMIKMLSSSSPSSREAAMGGLLFRLSALDDSDAAELQERLREAARSSETLAESACERLETANLGARLILIQFLGLLGDPRSVLPILLAGRDEAVEELTETTLENFGEIVPDAIEAVWQHLEPDVKRRACLMLGRTGGAVAEARLIATLDADDSEQRCAAARALGQGAFPTSLPALARCLEAAANDQVCSDDEVQTLMAAIVGMTEYLEAGLDIQVIEVLFSRLGGASEPLRLTLAQALVRVGRQQDEDIIAYLLKDESAAVRRAAVHALSRFEFRKSRDSLRLALGDESESVRTAAASVFGDVDEIDAAIDLKRVTLDGDSHVAAVAFRSIGHLYHRLGASRPDAYALIEPGLTRSAMVVLASLEALTEIGGEGAAALASEILGRPEPEIVRAAITCVGAHGSEDNLAKLVALVPHWDWSVRAEVASVLAERGYRKGLPALLRRLGIEDDVFVREAILAAIRRLEE